MGRGTRRLTLMAAMTALMCIAGPLTVPVGPVPVSMFSAVLMLASVLLGGRMAAGSCGAYLLLGAIGLPVFSGFTGGAGQLIGPTGGFLMGYLPMAALAGALCGRTKKRALHALSLGIGTILLYALGTLWFCLLTGADVRAALAVCVYPFVLFDLAKLLLVILIGQRTARLIR